MLLLYQEGVLRGCIISVSKGCVAPAASTVRACFCAFALRTFVGAITVSRLSYNKRTCVAGGGGGEGVDVLVK